MNARQPPASTRLHLAYTGITAVPPHHAELILMTVLKIKLMFLGWPGKHLTNLFPQSPHDLIFISFQVFFFFFLQMTVLGARLCSFCPKISACQAALQLETCTSAIVPNTLTHLCLSPTLPSPCVYVCVKACTSNYPLLPLSSFLLAPHSLTRSKRVSREISQPRA